jgi:hypothetical protein
MPDTRTHDEVYCPDCGRQWVASQGDHWAGCQHLDLAKRPSQMNDDELLRPALWLADGGLGRPTPSEPAWSVQDDRMVRGMLGRLVDDCQDQFVALARQHRGPVTDTAQTEEQASGYGTYARFVVLMLVTVGGIKQLPWPRWLKVALAIAANLLIGTVVYGTASKPGKAQVAPGRPGPLSMGAGVGPSNSTPEPEPTRPEPEPPPQPTKPPEPEPPKPEAISQQTLGTVERLRYRVGRGIAVVLPVAVVAVPVVWWLIARS